MLPPAGAGCWGLGAGVQGRNLLRPSNDASFCLPLWGLVQNLTHHSRPILDALRFERKPPFRARMTARIYTGDLRIALPGFGSTGGLRRDGQSLCGALGFRIQAAQHCRPTKNRSYGRGLVPEYKKSGPRPLYGVRMVGIEPTTHGLKGRCSTD